MNVNRYSLYRNSVVPVEGRKNVQRLTVAMLTYAKRQANNPFLIFNELIACRVAEALGIPFAQGVPVVAPIFENGAEVGADVYWGSLSVREDPPPADCQALAKIMPKEATGVTVFDALILNGDRSELNLLFDEQNEELIVFDHGEAICNSVGAEYLRTNRDNLGFDNFHAVGYELLNWDYLEHWLTRVEAIDTAFIRTIIRSQYEDFMTVAEAIELAAEFDRRRRKLRQLFSKHSTNREFFPSIVEDLLPPTDNSDANFNYQI